MERINTGGEGLKSGCSTIEEGVEEERRRKRRKKKDKKNKK
jgi:hypothetical protein